MNTATYDPYIDVATKIYEDIIDPWDRDPDAEIKDIAKYIESNPLPALWLLLNTIDDLRA